MCVHVVINKRSFESFVFWILNKFIDIKSIPVLPTSPHMPQGEHINVSFDTDYTDLKKNEK